MLDIFIVLEVLGFVALVTIYVIASSKLKPKVEETGLVTLCDHCMTLVEAGEGYQLMTVTPQGVTVGGALCPRCGKDCIEWLIANGHEGLIDT